MNNSTVNNLSNCDLALLLYLLLAKTVDRVENSVFLETDSKFGTKGEIMIKRRKRWLHCFRKVM